MTGEKLATTGWKTRTQSRAHPELTDCYPCPQSKGFRQPFSSGPVALPALTLGSGLGHVFHVLVFLRGDLHPVFNAPMPGARKSLLDNGDNTPRQTSAFEIKEDEQMIKSILITLLVIAPTLTASIEFAGVFYLGSDGSFSLVNSDTGKKSGWIQMGQSFDGYTIKSYDRESKTLRLISSTGHKDLALRASFIEAEKVTIKGKLRIGAGEEVEVGDAVLILGEEARFPIGENRWLRIKVDRDRPNPVARRAAVVRVAGTDGAEAHQAAPIPATPSSPPRIAYVYEIAFEERDSTGAPRILSSPKVTALPGRGFAIRVDQGDEEYFFEYEP